MFKGRLEKRGKVSVMLPGEPFVGGRTDSIEVNAWSRAPGDPIIKKIYSDNDTISYVPRDSYPGIFKGSTRKYVHRPDTCETWVTVKGLG